MITLHLITQDDQPYGSVRRCCEACGVMAPSIVMERYVPTSRVFYFFNEEGAWTNAPSAFRRFRSLEAAPFVACDRPSLAFRGWNDRGPRVEIHDGGDPGDCS